MLWSLGRRILVVMFLLIGLISPGHGKDLEAHFIPPKTALSSNELAVIVNDNDPLSVATADYYQKRRNIPPSNMIHVRFPSHRSILSREEFIRIKVEVDAKTPSQVQALALAWTAPYRVACMSITTAFAMGFDPAYCSSKTCAATRGSPYFDSFSHAPYADLKIRPAMMLAGVDFIQIKKLIDRGVSSDRTFPVGTAYLLKTSDQARTVRDQTFPEIVKRLGASLNVEVLESDILTHRRDVLFYFTGAIWVAGLDTLRFLPGALADHLTSAGGQLTDSGQMSALRWLEAGATASYGTVVEPCNNLRKFPLPMVVMWHYLLGNTAIEAYWKSVAWPGEGLFIGEPLAAPFAPIIEQEKDQSVQLKLFSPVSNLLYLEWALSPLGPFQPMGSTVHVSHGINQLDIQWPNPDRYYRLYYP